MSAQSIASIYARLPEVAQREAEDFLLFLQQRYKASGPLEERQGHKAIISIRENPGFGMWKDRGQDSTEILSAIRREQWRRD